MKKLKSININELLSKKFTQEEINKSLERFMLTATGIAQREKIENGTEFFPDKAYKKFLELKKNSY